MLAHELRNPLAAVANAATILKTDDGGEHAWAAGVIARQSGQLSRLIDDLLDVSRITTGKVRLRREVLDVAAVLDRARDSAKSLVEERQHTLACEYPRGQLWIEADATRMEQIVLNLLTNAAKYTPAGGRIALTATVEGATVMIRVEDNGVGIVPERLPEMFQLFAQGERSIARSEGGLGIGLTIVQKLVEMHGGRIDAHSGGPNQGSAFTVCLPLTRRGAARGEKPETTAARETRGRRVLIVDDNVDTAQGLSRLLARAGHFPQMAHDGLQALERARELQPEAVVLDIGLPGMDGLEVVQRLRQEEACARATIIAVTGYGQPADRQRALDAGFDHHMVKPVDLEKLMALLNAE
jgi:CheY-like chemotaxis protein